MFKLRKSSEMIIWRNMTDILPYSHYSWVIFMPFLITNLKSAQIFHGLWSFIFHLITFQMFSVGIRSRDWAAMSLHLVVFHPHLDWMLCGMEHCLTEKWSKFSSRITLYMAWFTCLLHTITCPIFWHDEQIFLYYTVMHCLYIYIYVCTLNNTWGNYSI